MKEVQKIDDFNFWYFLGRDMGGLIFISSLKAKLKELFVRSSEDFLNFKHIQV